jgi:ppGpp synthetase/RelA/SpoT-type nucleotidyltranferase
MQSKTQTDLLGERLKNGSHTEADLNLLDAYRRTFHSSYEEVTHVIREKLKLDPSGRPAKSTSSIIEKLLRESTRLSQIQDIAGCRVVVSDITEQLLVDYELSKIYPDARRVNRIQRPRYGYRAIHIIPNVDGKPIEIQLRTLLQHSWAELSEKYADKFGQALKYGGGEDKQRKFLSRLSVLIASYEELETDSFKKIIKHIEADDNVLADKEYNRLSEVRKLSKEIIEVIKDVGDELIT